MKILAYAVGAFLFCLVLGATSSVWSEKNTRLAQMGHMEHKDKGQSHGSSMGGMQHQKGMAKKGIFEGMGKVMALVPEKSQIVVGHEKIKGFMEAMPMGMGYPVESKKLLKGLKPGDKVKFKIDAATKKIVAIEPMHHMK